MTSSAIGHILRSPLYLAATAAIFLSSLGYAAAALLSAVGLAIMARSILVPK